MNQCFEDSNFTGFLHKKGKTTKKINFFILFEKRKSEEKWCVYYIHSIYSLNFWDKYFSWVCIAFQFNKVNTISLEEKFGGKHLRTNASNEILGCEIQDISTSISIAIISLIWLMTELDESDKHVEARDRRYSCLTIMKKSFFTFFYIFLTVSYKLASS